MKLPRLTDKFVDAYFRFLMGYCLFAVVLLIFAAGWLVGHAMR